MFTFLDAYASQESTLSVTEWVSHKDGFLGYQGISDMSGDSKRYQRYQWYQGYQGISGISRKFGDNKGYQVSSGI